MHSLVIGIITFFLYLASAFILGYRLYTRSNAPSGKWQALGVAIVAVSLHSWILFLSLFSEGGLNLGVFHAASLMTWVVAVLIILTALNRPTENLGIIAFPSAAIAIVLQHSFSASHMMFNWENPIEIHILISILAYSLLSIAAVQAIVLAIQDYHLRNRHPGGFIRALPPLQTMETLLFQMIGAGFALHSLSLITGIMFLENIFAQHLVHKTVLSLIAWSVFGTLLWGRWRFGWRGRTAIRWTLSGFAVLALAYLGSKLVLEVLLGHTA